jgi:hypothetical protein
MKLRERLLFGFALLCFGLEYLLYIWVYIPLGWDKGYEPIGKKERGR